MLNLSTDFSINPKIWIQLNKKENFQTYFVDFQMLCVNKLIALTLNVKTVC